MINWMYFPKNKRPDSVSGLVVQAFQTVADDFSKVCTFFDSLYASGRLGITLSGLLIIGY